MRRLGMVVGVGLLLAGATLAAAQEKTDPKQIVIGIAYLALDSEYAMITVDGESWEQFYYEDDGMTVVLEGVDRTKDYRVEVVPTFDELKPAVIKLGKKDWKLKRLDKETRQWQAQKKHKFAKWKPGEKEKFEAEQLKKAEEEKQKAEDAARKADEEAKRAAEDRPPDAPADKAEEPADAPADKVKKPADAPADKVKKPADAPTDKAK